ncbi:adenine-specific methyltransferase EcoRI family protein [Helicobacter sp. T3_23-1056]
MLESFEKNKHKLESKTTQLNPDKPNTPKEQSLFDINEDKDLGNAGDFRSKDCIELLKQSDIVVTNPPFSLFREYVAQLVEYDKKFVIIGNKNALTYKEIFKLVKENKIWIGYTPMSTDLLFNTSAEFQKEVLNGKKIGSGYKIIDGVVKLHSQSIWFANLDHKKRHEILETIHSFTKTPEKYPKYDNYDAINVDKTSDIPLDYDGIMGVPISFLDKYNPKQFKIIGQMVTTKIDEFNFGYPYINGKKIYARILIQKRKDSK